MDSFDSKNIERRNILLLLLAMMTIIVVVCVVSSYFIRNVGMITSFIEFSNHLITIKNLI